MDQSNQPELTLTDPVSVAIDAEGCVHWNGEALDRPGWRTRMDISAQQQPQPELQIRADDAVAYRKVGEVLAEAARAGLIRIGFVLDAEFIVN